MGDCCCVGKTRDLWETVVVLGRRGIDGRLLLCWEDEGLMGGGFCFVGKTRD